MAHVVVYSAAGGNLGDTAILTALVKQIVAVQPDATITLASPYSLSVPISEISNVAPTFDQLESFYLGRSWIRNSIDKSVTTRRAFNEADVVIIGGGGLINDQFGFAWLSQWLIGSLIGKLYKKKVIGIGLGAGPLKFRYSRLAVRIAFTGLHGITARDTYSYDSLLRARVPKHLIRLTQDPAFGLDLAQPSALSASDDSGLAIVPRFDDQKGGLTPKWWWDFGNRVSKITNRRCIFATVSESDYRVMAESLGRNDIPLLPAHTLELWQAALIGLACVLSSRMHGCILSAVCGVPTVPLLTYDPKLHSISQFLSQPLADLRDVPGVNQENELDAQIVECIDTAISRKCEMQSRVDLARNATLIHSEMIASCFA